MSYIFLDESGDLGFDFSKERTSKFFVITFLFVRNKRSIEKIVSKTHSQLRKKHKCKRGVLHCYQEKPITRQRLLKKLNEKDCSLMTIYLNKSKVYTRLQDEKTVLYNYVANILLDRIFSKKLIPTDEKITFIASRRETNKFLNENFQDYLSNQVASNHEVDFEVMIKTPHEEKGLQAVDFASWSIFRRQEHGDDTYYNLIKHILVEENPLFG